MPAAHLKKLSMPFQIVLNASRCKETLVTTRNTRQLIYCLRPELVPERAVTSPAHQPPSVQCSSTRLPQSTQALGARPNTAYASAGGKRLSVNEKVWAASKLLFKSTTASRKESKQQAGSCYAKAAQNFKSGKHVQQQRQQALLMSSKPQKLIPKLRFKRRIK
eukprot:787527-Pleurochrysis_carterae.AAC.5